MKLGLHITSTTTKKFFRQFFLTSKGVVPKTPFLATKWIFSLYLPNTDKNFPNFWYGNYPHGLLWENHSVYARKILVHPLGAFSTPKMLKIPPKVNRFCSKFALWVIWWCWFHFCCYFDPKNCCDPLGAFNPQTFYKSSMAVVFLKLSDFAETLHYS